MYVSLLTDYMSAPAAKSGDSCVEAPVTTLALWTTYHDYYTKVEMDFDYIYGTCRREKCRPL